MKYTYKARTKEGKIETGTVEANSREAAIQLLQKYNVFVTSLEEAQSKALFKQVVFEKKPSRKELVVFFRELGVMLESRVPVVQSLSILASQIRRASFKEKVTKIKNQVEEGSPLSEALGSHPEIFSSFYINLVKSGEASGNISGSLTYIAENMEQENEIISQVKQAMIYPAFVIAVLAVVVTIVIVVVMPRIVELIKESTQNPPFFTLLMIGVYQFIQVWWWAILAVLFFLAVSAVWYLRSPEGRKNFNKISLNLPFLNTFLKKVFLVRFCGNLATLMGAGVSINRALEITKDTVNNQVYRGIITELGQKVSEGEKVSTALAAYPDFFPPFVTQMIKVGEETGKLDKILVEIVSFYQKEIKRAIELFTILLEPIMIIFMGGVVAALAISVIAPLFGALGSV